VYTYRDIYIYETKWTHVRRLGREVHLSTKTSEKGQNKIAQLYM